MNRWNKWVLRQSEDGWEMTLETPDAESVWAGSTHQDVNQAIVEASGLLVVELEGEAELVRTVLDATGTNHGANCYETDSGHVLMTPNDLVAAVAMGLEVTASGFVDPRLPDTWVATEQDAHELAELLLASPEQEAQ